MFKSIQWRIAGVYILLIVVSIGILGIFITNLARNTQLNELRSHLEREARITAEAAFPAFLENTGTLDVLAKQLGQDTGSRITIIAPDGTVMGDSDEDPAEMENHANRIEVKEALATGMGESTRFSTTLGEQMMYVAVPIEHNGTVIGVARVALSMATVQRTVGRVTLTIILTVVVTVVLAAILAILLARFTTKPIREVTAASKRIASGELAQKIPVRSSDETGQLARAFNEMSTMLDDLVGKISTEKTRMATVLSSMTDAIIMTGPEGVVTLVNPAAEKMFSIRESDITGRSLIEAVRDHEVDVLLKSSLKTHDIQTSQYETGVSKRFVRAVAIPITQAELEGALILFQDLTELRSLQTMRRELIGNISHDLRTPMAGIKAMAETLREGAIEDRKISMDFLTRIDAEIDRMAQMVAELTELSRIETGQAGFDMIILNLNIPVKEAVTQMSPVAQRQGVTIEVNLTENLPGVKADKDRIRQTIVNLIHNAIKFNRPGGKVTVSSTFNTHSVTVSVADTGIGISKEDLPHVFERFYKADKARTKGGSGLGLAIAKHTIQVHGGTLQAHSEEGKGSIFSFSLPF